MFQQNEIKKFSSIFYLVLVVSFIATATECYSSDSSDDDSTEATANAKGFEYDGKNQRKNNREPYDIQSCCKLAFGSCRVTCENLSFAHLASNFSTKDVKVAELKRNCPSMQTDFWDCMNHTFNAISRGKDWSGRTCCPLAITLVCQNTCATSTNARETSSGCRRSDEQTLYQCFERQESGDDCCGNARTSECLHACRDIFQAPTTPTKEQRILMERVCNDNNSNSKVFNCVKQLTEVTPLENPEQYMPCCGHSRSALCRETCKNILAIGETTQQIIDALEHGGCGPPLPHEPVWQCFFTGNRHVVNPSSIGAEMTSQINEIGMDSAKLHCCHKAIAPKCRRLCAQTFSNEWTDSRVDFDVDCYEQMNEISLRQCLDEVDDPCELGCDGLSFCTNFNNRPTELFRSCNAHADIGAQSNLANWKETQTLNFPGLALPIKDIAKCSPEAWQAISCVLTIKPCSSSKHATQICREDCYDLLTKCIDWTRMETRHTAESICARFSIEETPCISLKPYMEPSDLPQHSTAANRIISPCRAGVCNSTEICTLSRRDVIVRPAETLYRCVAGCPLGETSSYLIPVGNYARVPVSVQQKDCFKVCRCGTSGRLENCSQLQCISYDSCRLSERQIEHGSWFHVECNICSCFAGDITCTKKQCRIDGISEHTYTSLPCNCPPHHVPVCGRNGYTYPSACVSKCAGLKDTDIEFGACRESDPCRDAKCTSSAKCVENRQVCLSVMQRPCRQYQCVNASLNCKGIDRPVCAEDGKTYASLCHLMKAKATLNYVGTCSSDCKQTPVCGINGISYKSECEAWSDFSLADYDGACREIGLLTDDLGKRCPTIKCESSSECAGGTIIPPGACCPVCGGAIRIIYSRKQIDRALLALKGRNNEILTLKGILRALESLIKVTHCRLSGFLTIESDIFVLVHSTGRNLTAIQIEACVKEAEKIATLIDTQSHRITSDLSLSALTVANIERSRDYDGNFSSASNSKRNLILILISISMIKFIYQII